MCQRRRLGTSGSSALSPRLVILIAIALQVVPVAAPHNLLDQSSFKTLAAQKPRHKLQAAYVNGLLSLKGSLLANNLQMRPILYPQNVVEKPKEIALADSMNTERQKQQVEQQQQRQQKEKEKLRQKLQQQREELRQRGQQQEQQQEEEPEESLKNPRESFLAAKNLFLASPWMSKEREGLKQRVQEKIEQFSSALHRKEKLVEPKEPKVPALTSKELFVLTNEPTMNELTARAKLPTVQKVVLEVKVPTVTVKETVQEEVKTPPTVKEPAVKLPLLTAEELGKELAPTRMQAVQPVPTAMPAVPKGIEAVPKEMQAAPTRMQAAPTETQKAPVEKEPTWEVKEPIWEVKEPVLAVTTAPSAKETAPPESQWLPIKAQPQAQPQPQLQPPAVIPMAVVDQQVNAVTAAPATNQRSVLLAGHCTTTTKCLRIKDPLIRKWKELEDFDLTTPPPFNHCGTKVVKPALVKDAQARDMFKDQLSQKLHELKEDLYNQGVELIKKDLQLAAQATSETPLVMQQMPGPVRLQPVQAQAMPMWQGMQGQAAPPATLQAIPQAPSSNGASSYNAKMHLLQQLADYFGRNPQQQQLQEQQQQEQLQQQLQEQQLQLQEQQQQQQLQQQLQEQQQQLQLQQQLEQSQQLQQQQQLQFFPQEQQQLQLPLQEQQLQQQLQQPLEQYQQQQQQPQQPQQQQLQLHQQRPQKLQRHIAKLAASEDYYDEDCSEDATDEPMTTTTSRPTAKSLTTMRMKTTQLYQPVTAITTRFTMPSTTECTTWQSTEPPTEPTKKCKGKSKTTTMAPQLNTLTRPKPTPSYNTLLISNPDKQRRPFHRTEPADLRVNAFITLMRYRNRPYDQPEEEFNWKATPKVKDPQAPQRLHAPERAEETLRSKAPQQAEAPKRPEANPKPQATPRPEAASRPKATQSPEAVERPEPTKRRKGKVRERLRERAREKAREKAWEKSYAKKRPRRYVFNRQQLLQAEIKLWPVKLSSQL